MQNTKNKTTVISIAIFLIISMGASTLLMSTASAHTPAWQIPTYAFIAAAPNPVGVSQTIDIYFWLDCVYGAAGGSTNAIVGNSSTASSALLSNNYRFHNYMLTITSPNGTSTITTFLASDPTSDQYTTFTPAEVGTYTFNFTFPGQVYGANGNGYEGSILFNDTYLPSSALTTLTVQQEPIPLPVTSFPLPSQFWSRPIYGENTNWYTISSNWLGVGNGFSGEPASGGASASPFFGFTAYHNDAIGPLTSHIIWTRPLQFGGVVGGNQFLVGGSNPNGYVPGVQYTEGSAYSPRFTNPIIINGYLYYTEPVAFTGTNSGPTVCVSLQTGQVLWSSTNIPPLELGYIYNLYDPDQHGVFPPILFTSSFAQAFDAYTGNALFNVTGVPSGTAVMGPSGEQLRYVMANAGTTANPQWYLAQWNSSKLWSYVNIPYTGAAGLSPDVINASNGAYIPTDPIPLLGETGTLPNGTSISIPYGSSITVNANVPINGLSPAVNGYQLNSTAFPSLTTYDWNISISWHNGQTPSPSIVAVNYGDLILCRNGSLPSGFAAIGTGTSQGPYTYFAVNLNATKGAVGSILWMQTYNPPAGNLTVVQEPIDFQNRVFTFSTQENMQWLGYSLDTGKLLWGPTASQTAFDYYGIPGTTQLMGVIAYGNLYDSSFAGILYCRDDLTGALKWTYGNGGAGNSTNAGLQVFYGDYPTQIQSIGNGVVYTATEEHTVPNPIYKGATYRAINASTGQEIWTLSGYASEWSNPGTAFALADGYATFMNGYDNNIYSVGQGPSAITVQAPLNAITSGENIVIHGTVIDVSAGTQQATQKADFPNGVPVASDASMTAWMGYVYQQKPFPANFTGVPVTIDVLDSNGNYRNIGTATTTESGTYSFIWTPDIPGGYQVIATFHGTNGYWGSYAQTTFDVMSAHPTSAPAATPAQSVADMYFVPAIAGLFVLIIIVLALVILLMLRKRP